MYLKLQNTITEILVLKFAHTKDNGRGRGGQICLSSFYRFFCSFSFYKRDFIWETATLVADVCLCCRHICCELGENRLIDIGDTERQVKCGLGFDVSYEKNKNFKQTRKIQSTYHLFRSFIFVFPCQVGQLLFF